MNGKREVLKMNSIYKYILISLCALTFSSCLQMEEQTPEEQAQEELVNLSFIASTEGEASTKTTLDGKLGEGTHQVLWNPEDMIFIIPADGTGPYEFTNTMTENSQTAIFEGQSRISDTYYAFYPHESFSELLSGKLVFWLSNELKYKEGSFPVGSFPMAAITTAGNEISFNNLCGLLALKMTGTETIKKITLTSGNKQPVAGYFEVDVAGSDWEITPLEFPTSSLSIDCGPEGVTLKESEPTVFYFILPPATYENLVFQFITEDGGVMLKRTEKPLTIKRSVLTPTGTLSYVESIPIDLSERGTANCYIVPPIFSSYTFDCTKKGNSSESVGDAASAEVVWETKNSDEVITEGEIISSVELIDGKVKFYLPAEPVPGNALIAVKDASGNILWSWHIWVTDYDPENDFDTYISGAKMMEIGRAHV